MGTEVQLIIPTKYGISESNSNVIAKNCIPIIQEFNKLEIDYDSIMSEKEMTLDICKQSKALRNKYVKVRTGGVKVIQSSKEGAKKQVDAHDQLNRDFKETINDRENQLREKELHFEKIEAEKLDKIRKERSTELEKHDTFYDAGDVALLDEVLWGHFLNGVKSDYEAKKEEERKAEEARVEAQRKQDLFYARREKLIQFSQFNIQNELTIETTEKEFIDIVEKGEKMKAEFDTEQIRIKAENERLKKEAQVKEKKEKELKLRNNKRNDELRPYIVFIRDYTALLNSDEKDYHQQLKDIKAGAELQWESDRKEEKRNHDEEVANKKRIENLNKAGKARHESLSEIGINLSIESCKSMDEDVWIEFYEQKNKIYQSEQNRIFTEKLKSEEARKAELAPDKERLAKWVNDMSISDIVNERMSKESVLIADEITDKFSSFKKWAKGEIEKIN